MSQGSFLVTRVSDDGTLKRKSQTTAFGTAGLSVTVKAGRIYKVTVHNKSATPYFVQVHDKATAPVNTEVPIWEERLAASSSVTFTFDYGLYCALGINLALSSTVSVLTLAVAADGVAYLHYAAVT